MTNRRRADEALEAHLWLYDMHHRHPVTSYVCRALLDVTVPQNREVDLAHWPTSFADYLHHDVFGAARTWTATTDMFEQIVEGVDFLLDEDINDMVLSPEHLPADTGVVIFPRGVEIPFVDVPASRYMDARGRTMGSGGSCGDRMWLDGFAWKTTDAIRTPLDKTVAPTPAMYENGWELTPGVQIFPLTRYRHRDEDRPFRITPDVGIDSPQPPWAVSDFTAWAYDRPIGLLPDQGADSTLVIRLYVWLYWAFARDRLPATERPSRPLARRAKPIIHENPADEPGVLVVKLRHEHDPTDTRDVPDGAEPRWWRCRWIVSEHWANRRYAIRDDSGRPVGPTRGPDAIEGVTYELRKVKIGDYTKGPDHMPLRTSHKVHVLAE